MKHNVWLVMIAQDLADLCETATDAAFEAREGKIEELEDLLSYMTAAVSKYHVWLEKAKTVEAET